MKKIITPLEEYQIEKLKVGEPVLLSGTIYTARDQAHKRLTEAINRSRELPIDLKGAVIYYCGPTKIPKGEIIGTSTSLECHGEHSRTIGTSTSLECHGEHSRTIGSCGPTTSSRMDAFTPILLKAGLKGMIGKGDRSEEVITAIKRYRAVYFLTYAGCGALLAKYIKKAKPVAYKALGPEAIYKLEVKDFPLIVGIDAKGMNIYKKSKVKIKKARRLWFV